MSSGTPITTNLGVYHDGGFITKPHIIQINFEIK